MKQAKTQLTTAVLISLMSTAGVALPYPVLAPYFMNNMSPAFTQYLGLPSELLFGIVVALYPLGLLLGSSVIGAASDLYGRKTTLLVTLWGSLAGYGLSVLALVMDAYVLFAVARLLTGIFEGNGSIARAIAADLDPVIPREKSLPWVYGAAYGGWMVGPMLGGLMMTLWVGAAFVAAGGILLLAILLVWVSVPSQKVEAPKTPLVSLLHKHNSFSLVAIGEIRPIFYFYLLYCLGITLFYEFNPIWLVEVFDATPMDIAWLSVVFTLGMIFVSAVGHKRITDQFGTLPTIGLFIILTGVLIMAMTFNSLTGVYVLFLFTGMTAASVGNLFGIWFSDRFQHHGNGKVFGLTTAIFCLANVVVGIAGGLVAVVSTEFAMVLAGLLMIVSLIWLTRLTSFANEATSQ